MALQWAPPTHDGAGNAPWWLEDAGDGWFRCRLCSGKPYATEGHLKGKVHVKNMAWEQERLASLTRQGTLRASAQAAQTAPATASTATNSATVGAHAPATAPNQPPPPPKEPWRPSTATSSASSAAMVPPPLDEKLDTVLQKLDNITNRLAAIEAQMHTISRDIAVIETKVDAASAGSHKDSDASDGMVVGD